MTHAPDASPSRRVTRLNLARAARLMALAGIVAPASIGAQGGLTLPAGESRDLVTSIQLPSTVLGESRTIDVALPASYAAQGTRRYPVLVVLDAESQHLPATALARFFASVGQLPELIIVGVRNTNRNRDLSPPPQPGWRPPPGDFGGAGRFARFLAEELLPRVDHTYRTEPFRVLVGHSLGGLFGLHLLATQPGLFGGYVIMEPSTWWNDQHELGLARRALASPALRHARVMLAGAPPLGVDTTSFGGARPMVREFRTPGEVHASMPIAGMMHGLRTMFADFSPMEWRPGLAPSATLAATESLSVRLGIPIALPEDAVRRAFTMAIMSRMAGDAERIIGMAERNGLPQGTIASLRAGLDSLRATPAPAGFRPLEFPATRPSARIARATGLLGTWRRMEDSRPNQFDQEIEIMASGDTLLVRSTTFFPRGPSSSNLAVVSLDAAGEIAWAEPLRGIAGAFVFSGSVQGDGSLVVHSDVRGFAPPPGATTQIRQGFQRIAAH